MRRSIPLIATIALLAALPGCGRTANGVASVVRQAPMAAQATPAPIAIGGLKMVTLDDDWTQFRLDIFEEDHEEPVAQCTFEAVFQVDPTTNQGLLKVTKMQAVTIRGRYIFRRMGDQVITFDKKRVSVLVDELKAYSTEVGFPNGMSVAYHLQALVAGLFPRATDVR